MNFRSYTDLTRVLVSGIHKVPADVDLVVALPRSGVIPATMLALHLNLPVTDFRGFLENRVWGTGTTRGCRYKVERVSDCKHALIVDDSVWSGGTLKKAREAIAAANLPLKTSYAAAFVTKESRAAVDVWFDLCEFPRVFQWNLMHHHVLDTACVDIDGVLCHDPLHEENDDGDRYIAFLLGAKPLHLPSRRIHHLVTSRLEKYRPQTEAWLKANGVEFDRLSMIDLPDAATRRRLGVHARHKAEAYRRDETATFFIESEKDQALEICRLSGKPVLCVADYSYHLPNALSPAALRQHGVRTRQGVQWLLGAGYRRLRATLTPRG